jgi:hypothetical protein
LQVSEAKAEWWRRSWVELLRVFLRVLSSLIGAIIMFAFWLMTVLAGMPRPPVPPSFAVTLTAPVITAVGFSLGMLVADKLTRTRQGGVRGTFLWSFIGGTVGTLMMFPFGGMMAGFGMFGLATATVLIRELRR